MKITIEMKNEKLFVVSCDDKENWNCASIEEALADALACLAGYDSDVDTAEKILKIVEERKELEK